MATTVEKIFTGKDNTIDLVLKENGTAKSLASVTRMTLTFGSTVVDSAITGKGVKQPFDWTTGGGILFLQLGGAVVEGTPATNIPAGTYRKVKLTIFAPNITNGVVWGNLKIVVE